MVKHKSDYYDLKTSVEKLLNRLQKKKISLNELNHPWNYEIKIEGKSRWI